MQKYKKFCIFALAKLKDFPLLHFSHHCMPRFVEVIVPVPLPGTFTYRVPPQYHDMVRPLMRVAVSFGKNKSYTGIVTEVRDIADVERQGLAIGKDGTEYGGKLIKDISWLPDSEPILRRTQLQLWKWMADYYMCSLGEVMKAALPAGLKIDAETIVTANEEFSSESIDPKSLDADLVSLWETVVKEEKISVHELQGKGHKNILSNLYRLMDMGVVSIREKLSERFRPKTEEFYEILLDRNDHEVLERTFKSLRSGRHQTLLMQMLHLSDFTRRGAELSPVFRDQIKDEASYDRAILRSFEKKGFIVIRSRSVSRFRWTPRPLSPLPVLSPSQRQARDELTAAFTSQSVVLLHGVTSSGKTEIYMHLIDTVLRSGRQALLLVPEIALTTQLTARLQNVFGDKVVVYHSRFSDAERAEIWQNLLHDEGSPRLIVGARSSVFLPFSGLGLVIVDEEHEQSYKQIDPAPRYNARDVAVVLSRLHGAKTLLASATPTVETYYKAESGRFGLVSLLERYGGVRLPRIEVIDMGRAHLKGEVRDSLALATINLAESALADGRQVIIFNNRRGYSPLARCTQCQYIPRCVDCDVALTYHKGIDRLVCHYCGREYPNPKLCPSCGQPTMQVVGYGTERVEDGTATIFPQARILRMDLDTTRNKDSYSRIIDDFSAHRADILIGTQMVAKGLDFAGVSTVIALNADMLINFPDYRSSERAFAMLEQVAGRAGRREGIPGNVVIQTSRPDHPVIKFVLSHDFMGFYKHELSQRKEYLYPPFTRLIYVFVRHRDRDVCRHAATQLAALLKGSLGNRVLGPHEPTVTRIKNLYIRRIMIKAETTVSLTQVKNVLLDASSTLRAMSPYRSVQVYFDVDPV